MKRIARIFFVVILVGLFVVAGHIYSLTRMQAKEIYLEENYLDTEKNKIALVIVAHDDDAISCAGTLSMMCDKGWKIRETCFYTKRGGNERDSIRKQSLQQAANIEGLSGIDTHEFIYRNDLETNKEPWLAMPLNLFEKKYSLDTLYKIISAYIEKYNPSVILTLDDSIGGYGHPDHVMISKLVLKYCQNHRDSNNFSVKRIYQPVFAPSLAENILGKGYQFAKKTYSCNGMPLPTVQVNISKWGEKKKKAMTSFTTEQNSLKKIWPYYNWYPSFIYFKIFNREFFRVIRTDKGQ